MSERKPKSYRDLEIWVMSHDLAVAVHKMTFSSKRSGGRPDNKSKQPASSNTS